MFKRNGNKSIIIGVSLLFVGIALIIDSLIPQKLSCWGHLGCGYYTRSFDTRWYLGMIFTAISGYLIVDSLFSKVARSRKTLFIYKVLLVSAIIVSGLIVPLILSSTIFVP